MWYSGHYRTKESNKQSISQIPSNVKEECPSTDTTSLCKSSYNLEANKENHVENFDNQ